MNIIAMKSIFLSFIALAVLTNCSNENIEHADFIFSGSDIYTANESQDVVDTIAIRKDKIIFVGKKEDSEKLKNELTREIKLDGKMILPFFSLRLLVTGSHLSDKFGNTFSEIEKDGFEHLDFVDLHLSEDDPQGISESMAIGLQQYTKIFAAG